MATFTESVSSSIALTQVSSNVPYRRPLYIKQDGERTRIARLPAGEFINGVPPSSGGGGGTQFLESTLSDIGSATYYYYGGLDENNDWKINRYLKSNINSVTSATEATNGSYTTLSSAWANRAILSYS